MKKEFLVGLFIFFGIIGLGITVFVIKDIHLEPGYRLKIYFDDVGNLLEKAWVRMRGVKIGKVEKIELEGEKAKVTVWIKQNVKIHRGTVAKITSTGVLGVKYLELTVGDPTQPLLKDGDSVDTTFSVISIDDALSQGMSGIKNLTSFLEKISDSDVSERINSIISNIEEFSNKLTRIDEKRINTAIRYIETAGKDIKEILEKDKENISSTILSLRTIAEEIVSTNTIAGQIIADKEAGRKFSETINSLKQTSEQANRTLARINLFRTYWDYRSRYDIKNDEFKSDLGIEIFPKENKFYYLTVNNVGSDQTAMEKYNTISIGIGGNFYNYLTLYGGLLRSTGGVGIKIFPLGYKSRFLEFGTEIYNFSKTREYPNIDISLRVRLLKWLYVGSRYEDINHLRAVNTSLNITFEDEDIAYLIGLLSLSR